MANPQMFVEVVTTGAQAAVTVVGHGNDVGDAFGDDKDFVIVLKSAVNGANTGITDVLEGTPVTPALPVNSAILSNTTANGDLLIAANTGSNSEAVFWADASAGDTAVMAASGGSADIYIAGTKEYDFSASSADFNANTIDDVGTISATNAAGPSVINLAATTTVPTLVPNRAETDTGIGWASDTLHVVLGASSEYSFSASTLNMGNNTLTSVGASGNDFGAAQLDLASGYTVLGAGNLTIRANSTNDLLLGTNGATLIYLDGGTDSVGINTTAGSRDLVRIAGSFTSGAGSGAGLHVEPTYTGDASNNFSTVQIGGTLVEAGSGTHALVSQLRLVGNAVTNNGATTTTASTLYINAAMSGADTNNYAIFVDGGLSRFDGDIDLNSAGTLLNVGASGNDWTANSLKVISSYAGSVQINIENTNTGGGADATLTIKTNTGAHDPNIRVQESGGNEWVLGLDNSQSDRFYIGTATGGSNDALRISHATPPVATYNTTHPTGTFDYVCESCGKHEAASFACCGPVEWHDDVMDFRAMAMQEERGLDYMERVGVIERTTNNEGDPEIFTVLGRDFEFAMSAAFQNRQRMDAQYDAMDERLARIEAVIGV
jgi:hypothetical protein